MASLLQYEVERSQFNNSLISEHIEVFYIKTSLFITDCMFACVPDESSARISWIFVLSDNKRGEGWAVLIEMEFLFIEHLWRELL